MFDLDSIFSLTRHLSEPIAFFASAGLFGYVGLGPGPELIPYVLALGGVVLAAFVALVQWPIFVLRDYIRRKRRGGEDVELETVAAEPAEQQRDAVDDAPGK